MATYNIGKQEEKQRECFLCTLDPKRPCFEEQLEGQIIAAQERVIDGAKTPILLLDTGTSRVELHLQDQYYRSLVRGLKARGDVIGSYGLRLRVYHLPTEPVPIEYKGKNRSCYKGNAYTLAVLSPDTLLNITDLNMAEYCPRQHMLNRLRPSSISAATLRGNLVHHCFKELLKEHDHGKPSGTRGENDADKEIQEETALDALHRHLAHALHLNSLDMALANISVDTLRADVIPHLESLARWYESERNTLWDMPANYTEVADAEQQERQSGNQVRAETFLLAPEIGLRGRLDLFWQQSGRQRLLELKTGGAKGELPKREHRWQVYGYHALLTVRRDSKMKRALATLLYTGTPGSAQAFGIPASIREIQRVNETRNILVLSHITGIPTPPPGPSRCTKCAMLDQCQSVSALLDWQPPETDNRGTLQREVSTSDTDTSALHAASPRLLPIDTTEYRDFFSKYYKLLLLEGFAGEQQQALLWKTPVNERIERGTALRGLEALTGPTEEKDGWMETFRCANTSELREGDEILLSSGNPITGEVVTGTILSISSEQVSVWTRELIAHPLLIDRYENDLVHVRTLQNLLRWLQANSHLRDLVAGKIRPRFLQQDVTQRADFNQEQNLAVERALQMQDYLLIHGPPGTGKTSVIAEIVKRLCDQGQRVLLAGFTNQAVDNMLKRLDKDGFHEYLRLGHDRSVDESIRPRLLKTLADAQLSINEADGSPDGSLQSLYSERVLDLLNHMPVVASTTATWSSDKYAPQVAENSDLDLHFDVAIIDEAGQLTVPAILGALRFTKRFILVGDEKQLPPLVLSKAAAEQGLADSLFGMLKQLDEDYIKDHPLTISACVALLTQYRMNRWISNFSSTLFYEKRLLAHASVAHRKLHFPQVIAPPGEDAVVAQVIAPQFPLVFLDVRDGEANAQLKLSNAEARAVRAVVVDLRAHGIEAKDIGIIAPYRAQVANIRRHLLSSDAALAPASGLSVDTVDRFQGGERSVIIMSFATTHEPERESQRREFLVNAHRLNVALTRAQSKLILVGCIPALEHLPVFERLIAYCQSMNTVFSYIENG
ncbi:MAG TPA: AAA domain-containing protein [Ktedonobacteraceae bacterium]